MGQLDNKKILNWKAAYPYLLLIIGGALLIWHFSGALKHETWNEVIGKLGEIALVSTLITFLIDSAEYFGVFKKGIEDIIYDAKNLSMRRDIDDIWVRVSKEMFDSKFPHLVKPLMEKIKYNYLPNKEVFYYEDYVTRYDITWDPNEKDIIQIQTKTSFVIKSDSEKKIILPINNTTCTKPKNKDRINLEYTSFVINGVSCIPKQSKRDYDNNVVESLHEIPLKDSKTYNVDFTMKQKQCIDDDNYIGFRARWIVNKIRVQIFYPEDLNVIFVDRGTTKRFSEDVKDDKCYAEFQTKELLLRNQGYILILQRRNKHN
ncbi:hypothetical protein [Porphyromonas levii]|uniref:hypothetical protein n=1 Tax=Porphyromonas levii TaxID=28114 RepID=UPI001B8C8BD9|nr:hypothetical protein [Porphyromonas levii]MBR8759247.1 hypothetical protein [Porphyromonas levii]